MSSQSLNAPRIKDWCRWYRSAQPDYKAHALVSVLKADGIKMLHAVLKELNLLDSTSLVADWNDSTTKSGPPKDDVTSPGEDA